MSPGLYLRFAGPLQSWAGPRISGEITETERRPTRSALEGMCAAALGITRDRSHPEWFSQLNFAIRIDQDGRTVSEFQTAYKEEREFRRNLYLLYYSKGSKRAEDAFLAPLPTVGVNAILRRTHLAEAEFIIRMSSSADDPSIIHRLDEAFANPVFTPYLGKKAFPPGFPFYLGIGEESQLLSLPTLPIHQERSRQGNNEPGENRALTVCEIDSFGLETWSHGHEVPVVKTRDMWLTSVGEMLSRRSSH